MRQYLTDDDIDSIATLIPKALTNSDKKQITANTLINWFKQIDVRLSINNLPTWLNQICIKMNKNLKKDEYLLDFYTDKKEGIIGFYQKSKWNNVKSPTIEYFSYRIWKYNGLSEKIERIIKEVREERFKQYNEVVKARVIFVDSFKLMNFSLDTTGAGQYFGDSNTIYLCVKPYIFNLMSQKLSIKKQAEANLRYNITHELSHSIQYHDESWKFYEGMSQDKWGAITEIRAEINTLLRGGVNDIGNIDESIMTPGYYPAHILQRDIESLGFDTIDEIMIDDWKTISNNVEFESGYKEPITRKHDIEKIITPQKIKETNLWKFMIEGRENLQVNESQIERKLPSFTKINPNSKINKQS